MSSNLEIKSFPADLLTPAPRLRFFLFGNPISHPLFSLQMAEALLRNFALMPMSEKIIGDIRQLLQELFVKARVLNLPDKKTAHDDFVINVSKTGIETLNRMHDAHLFNLPLSFDLKQINGKNKLILSWCEKMNCCPNSPTPGVAGAQFSISQGGHGGEFTGIAPPFPSHRTVLFAAHLAREFPEIFSPYLLSQVQERELETALMTAPGLQWQDEVRDAILLAHLQKVAPGMNLAELYSKRP